MASPRCLDKNKIETELNINVEFDQNQIDTNLLIKNPIKNSEKWIKFNIDTGFSGGILLKSEDFQELALNQIVDPSISITMETIFGISSKKYECSKCKVQINDKSFETWAICFEGNNYNLIGIEGLKNLLICLDIKDNFIRFFLKRN